MTEYYGRMPFAHQSYELDEIIPAIPDGPVIDENSPLAETEVRFSEDENARHKSIYYDWHEQDRELEIVCGYCSIRREMLNLALHEAQNIHGPVETVAVTLAIKNARAHAAFLLDLGFKRTQDRSRTTWTYVSNVEEQRTRRHHPKRHRIVVKLAPDPKPELKPLMTVSEYQNKTAELDALRSRIKKLEDGGAT